MTKPRLPSKQSLADLLTGVREFLFVPLGSGSLSRTLAVVFFCLVFAGGIVHWFYFLHGGEMTFQAFDWTREYSLYSVIQAAVRQMRIPYFVDHPFFYTERFIAIPDTNLSPQVFLLNWLDIPQFILANALFMYSLFFAGCLLLMRRYRLPPFAFLAMVTLAGLNGTITAHLAVGHSMWIGVLLLPFFAYTVLEIVQQDAEARSAKPAVLLGLVLFGMFLQGALHLMIWCWMFLGFLALGSWRYLKPVATALALSVLLSSFRFIPAVLTFQNFGYDYISGFPSLGDLWAGLTRIRDLEYPHIGGFFGTLGWHEYDVFIGLVGVAFLVGFGIYLRVKKDPALDSIRFAPLDVPIILVTLLSINYAYLVVARLPIPLVNSERVSSRFLIVPLVMLIVLSSIRFGWFLPTIRRSAGAQTLFLAAYVVLVTDLGMHSFTWRLGRMENQFPHVPYTMAYHIVHQVDPGYVASVNFGIALSLATLAGVLLCLARPRLARLRRPGVPH